MYVVNTPARDPVCLRDSEKEKRAPPPPPSAAVERRQLVRALKYWSDSKRHKREGTAFQAEVTVWA